LTCYILEVYFSIKKKKFVTLNYEQCLEQDPHRSALVLFPGYRSALRKKKWDCAVPAELFFIERGCLSKTEA
jgi:hypothetical protein